MLRCGDRDPSRYLRSFIRHRLQYIHQVRSTWFAPGELSKPMIFTCVSFDALYTHRSAALLL